MKFYSSLSILIILSLVFWLTPFEKDKKPDFHLANHPEEYMTDVSVWHFTEEGSLKHFLSTCYWAYQPETTSSSLTTPHLTVYRPDNSIWNIDAKKGKVKQPNIGRIEQVELLENVVLERPQTKADVPIKVETEVICYQPKKQYAETDEFITLTKPDLKITGTGMRVFLDKSFVELLHNVKTSYLPGG